MTHDKYKKIDANGAHMEPCPCCGSEAELWQFSKAIDEPTNKVVCCAHGEQVGPQDEQPTAGCLLFMSPDDHYKATAREAITFWNEFAKALCALQRKNRWASANVLREPTP